MGFELMGWWGGVEVKVILVRLNNLFTVFKWAVLYKWVLCSWGFLFTKPFPPRRDYLLGHRGHQCLPWYNARAVLQVSVLAFGSSAVELSGPGRLIGSLLWSPAEIWVIFLEKGKEDSSWRERWPWFHDGPLSSPPPPVGEVEGNSCGSSSWVWESKAYLCAQWFGISLVQELWQLGRLFYPSFHANPQSWVASEEKRFNVVYQEAEGPDITAHAMLRSPRATSPEGMFLKLVRQQHRSQTVLVPSKGLYTPAACWLTARPHLIKSLFTS